MAGAAATFAKIARHDFLSMNAGVHPTRSSLQITGLQNELFGLLSNMMLPISSTNFCQA
jgi:hypothetical protein